MPKLKIFSCVIVVWVWFALWVLFGLNTAHFCDLKYSASPTATLHWYNWGNNKSEGKRGRINSCYKGEQNYLTVFSISKVNLIWSSHNDQLTLDVGELYQPFGQGKALSYAL